MYYVAKVDADKCATHESCNMCTLHCPEANTLMFNKDSKFSYVDADKCKGCSLCVYVCSEVTKNDCITMEMPHK